MKNAHPPTATTLHDTTEFKLLTSAPPSLRSEQPPPPARPLSSDSPSPRLPSRFLHSPPPHHHHHRPRDFTGAATDPTRDRDRGRDRDRDRERESIFPREPLHFQLQDSGVPPTLEESSPSIYHYPKGEPHDEQADSLERAKLLPTPPPGQRLPPSASLSASEFASGSASASSSTGEENIPPEDYMTAQKEGGGGGGGGGGRDLLGEPLIDEGGAKYSRPSMPEEVGAGEAINATKISSGH